MFRESDYRDPRPHPSYKNKPVPALQKVAQNSKFESEREIIDPTSLSIPVPIPTTWDTKFDPNNPKADWAVISILLEFI